MLKLVDFDYVRLFRFENSALQESVVFLIIDFLPLVKFNDGHCDSTIKGLSRIFVWMV